MDKGIGIKWISKSARKFGGGKENNAKKGSNARRSIISLPVHLGDRFSGNMDTKTSAIGITDNAFQNCKPCLLYADDTLFLIKPEQQQMRFLKIILQIFERMVGLRINLQKSELLVTTAQMEETQRLAEILGCGVAEFPITYLGMPLTNKRLKKEHYMPLIHKITKKLSRWKASMLSIGGRVTLINATLSAMPVYMMQTFLLPKWVIAKIDRVRRRFLWHGH